MLTQLFAAAVLLGPGLEDPYDTGVRLLPDAYPDTRARGVRKLAKLGTPEAWARVRQHARKADTVHLKHVVEALEVTEAQRSA